MATQLKLRRDTASNWMDADPTLAEGEPGFETDTGKLKIGDGSTIWSQLDYLTDSAGGSLDRLISGNKEVVLTGGVNPFVTFPTVSNGDQLIIQGSEISSPNGSAALTAQGNIYVTPTGSNTAAPWTFNTNGNLVAPIMLPVSFTAVLDSEHLVRGVGLTATPWEFQVQFQVDPNGVVQTYLNNIFPNPSENPGYISGDEFVYVEADHGIPGYTFTITLNNLAYPGGAGWTANVGVTTPPTYPSTVFSGGAIKLTADTRDYVFGTNGTLTLPENPTITNSIGNIDIVSANYLSLNAGTYAQLELGAQQTGGAVIVGGVSTHLAVRGRTVYENQDTTFPLTLDSDHYVSGPSLFGGSGEISLALTLNKTGIVYNWSIATLTMNGTNQGYQVGEQFQFDYTVHGIPNHIVTVEITSLTEVDPDVWELTATVANPTVTLAEASKIEFASGVGVKVGAASWLLDTDGKLYLPSGGDIVDSNGSSVLGGGSLTVGGSNGEGGSTTVNNVNEILVNGIITNLGDGTIGITTQGLFRGEHYLELNDDGSLTLDGSPFTAGVPTIPNTKRGFINLVGDRPNENDDIAFESVVVRGQYAYVLGTDYYINNSNSRAKVYKFDLQTGEQVWVKQISAGRGATFAITIGSGTITIDAITQSGEGYQIGEEIPFEGYQVGGSSPENSFIIVVDTIDVSGGILTASVKPGYNAGAISYNSTVNSYYEDAQGDTVAISYDDFNEKLVIVQEYSSGRGNANDSFWNWANVYVMDPVTGVINQTVTLTEEGDIYPNSIATHDAAGGVAIVGEKYNEYREFGPLTISAGYNGYFDILKSNLDPEHYPGAPYNSYSDFWITGTGIANQENVDQVNEYANVATTVREGSGATFNISDNGDGTYGYSETISAGTNYLTGHKIKILGTSLGGATPANDCIITITNAVDGAVSGVSLSGTAAGGSFVLYSGVSGTNYNVGSGYTAYIYINPTTGAFTYGGSNNGGSNYVAGDVITVPGTTFAGGTSPANDATLVVNTVDGSGSVQSITNGTASGTGPTGTIRIKVDGVDFTTGTYSMRQNLGGEAFIWTPSWSNAIGGPSGDKFYDVCWKADGTALYAVGTGVYETDYLQALVVKFNAVDGAVVWSKDIKFAEAVTEDRWARAVAVIPGSTDIMVAGAWYNNSIGYPEIILTRLTDAGAAVWQKTYALGSNFYETNYYLDYEINLKETDNGMIVSFEQGTNNGNGLGWLQIDPTNGTVIRHRVLSADGNSNYNYYNTPTANFADIYTDVAGDYIVMAGFTYVPTDYYYNGLLFKLPVTGVKDIEPSEKLSLGEHILTRHDIFVTTVTPAFDSFTPDEHIDTITNLTDQRNYKTRAPDGELRVWTYTVTDDSAGYLEFGDGSRQSFATNVIPQIPAANDYYLTEQDSGKHIFFEHENGWVYIPHWQNKQLPVGFTFTIVNTTGSDCYVQCQSGGSNRGRLKLAGRNIETYTIGIPDSGSGSMVTFLKVKEGYTMDNSDGLGDYSDVWMVSGPGDIYDND